MISTLKAEFLKLVRPIFLILTLAALALSFFMATMGQQTGAAQFKTAKDNLALSLQRPTPCSFFGLKSGKRCDRARAQDLVDARNFVKQTIQDTRLGSASQQPLGAAGFAAGVMSSVPGAFLILLLAAFSLGGEWSGRTMKIMLLQDGRRARLLLAKLVVLWVASVWLLLWTIIGQIAYGQLFRRVFVLPPPPGLHDIWAYAGPRLLHAPLALLLFAALGLAMATLVRQPIGAFFGGALCLIVVNFLARFSGLHDWTPAGWLASWMHFKREPLLFDHLWADKMPSAGEPRALHGLIALIAALVTIAIVDIRRRDIQV